MDSSDEDFLPDPERPRRGNMNKWPDSKQRKPPDPTRGRKRKLEEDITKGKCFFYFLNE